MFNVEFRAEDIPISVLRAIYQYWLEMKDDRPMPSRADLNPSDIVDYLPYIGLIDYEKETGRFKYRLVGTETVKAMGMDITGKYLDELPFVEKFIKSRFECLVQKKQPYYFSEKLNWSNKSFLDYYALGLPLSQNGKDVNMLMFGLYYSSSIDQLPPIEVILQ